MITQRYPFGGLTADRVYYNIRYSNPDWPASQDVTPVLKKLINGMLHTDPARWELQHKLYVPTQHSTQQGKNLFHVFLFPFHEQHDISTKKMTRPFRSLLYTL